MFLKSLAGFEHKFAYDIVGHSGDEHAIELVRKNQPPKNNKERLKLLKLMYTHTMFCNSDDNTLPALKTAIDALQAEPHDTVDERFVIVISDANFDRYGLSPKVFGKMLQSNEKCSMFHDVYWIIRTASDTLTTEFTVRKRFRLSGNKSNTEGVKDYLYF